ncbi:MAG: hypothetical protein AB1632_07245 [Nitrospirota bacterium]
MRKSYSFFIFIAVCLVIISGLAARSTIEVSGFRDAANDLREITAALKLTDICFSSDARYTRHPAQADLFSAFQDYPGSIEHFPSGSVVSPPDFITLDTKILVRNR